MSKGYFLWWLNGELEKDVYKRQNIGLKEIGKLLKIDDLEYYAARHSWATLAVNQVRCV